MVSKEKILDLIKDQLAEKELFIISLEISSSNNIKVIIDGMKGVSINDCVMLSRRIEHNLDRDEDDFELEVSSAGITEPFRIREQYLKNLGREVEVVLKNGLKETGKLINADDNRFGIKVEKWVRTEGKKKKQRISEIKYFDYQAGSKVRTVIKF
jgi:ribosome maturation factor RimP